MRTTSIARGAFLTPFLVAAKLPDASGHFLVAD
jgi:hypothetical protein